MAALVGLCLYMVSPVSNKNKKIIFEVKPFTNGYGMKSLISDLKKENLIRNESFTYYYVRLNKFDIEAGTYVLNSNMGLRDIFTKISDSSNVKEDTNGITTEAAKKNMELFKCNKQDSQKRPIQDNALFKYGLSGQCKSCFRLFDTKWI